ncbi:MAG: hypothetical protein EXS46_02330 [Candidatus Taylorbacteria bacterium]|nr:hypothetical protein [Candidatus Taylorbacteria bacterium]
MTERIKNEIGNQKNAFWFLVIAIVVFLGLYFYFFGHTIYSVVERQTVERRIIAIESGAEEMEMNYLSEKSKITLDLAKSKGFTKITLTPKYISRTPTGKSLTLNN